MNSRLISPQRAMIAVTLVILAALLGQPAAEAATYRTWIAQVPANPTAADTVRVWMNSDTAFGETAGLEYNVGSSYVKVLGTYDNTGYPGANWRADIPAQPAGTFVRYQLFTRNQSGSDYGFTGFNWSYTVAGPITLSTAKAIWLDAGTIAWSGAVGNSYKLLYDPDGGLTSAAAATACAFPAPASPCYVTLTASGTIANGSYPKNPNANGLTNLTTGLSADNAKFLLKGQTAVASYNSGGALVEASRTQVQSVLDALYAANAKTQALGVTYTAGAPSVKLWAPTAKSVTLRRYATSSGGEVGNVAMTLDATSGIWSATGVVGWNRQYYLFDVQVYVPGVDAVVNNLVTDPYAVTLSTDGATVDDVRGQFVNLADADLKPSNWDTLSKPTLNAFEDISIYEMHIRDFSINDATVTSGDRGTYNAFTYDGAGPDPNTALSNGMKHLQALQAAGLTHVHLLPAFDIASVVETSVPRSVTPNPTGYARDSDQQQTAVAATRATDGFNWGYDPYHYGAPEGSYSTDPNGVQRILEFRRMVSALNRNGLRVVMDVVYNHTAASGQNDHSVLDKVVPGYYYRYTTNGDLYTTSCCSDTATEYEMMEKLMIDTVKRFAVDYKVDGFRFDLMNFHTKQNMLNLKAAVQGLTTGAEGVDGSKIYLYGEGWDFGSAKDKGLMTCPNCYAQKYNMTGSGIGAFNDIIRDAAHGGYSTDTVGIRKQGFINGLSYDWNGYSYSNRSQNDLWNVMDTLRSGLRGSGTDWNGQGAPFTDDPQESVPYVEKHDNETLFDQNAFKLPNGSGSDNPGWIGSSIPTTSVADRVRSQNMGQSLIGLAQGVPFFQMGTDILRSKSLDRNSYDSGDWFNRLDWTYSVNNFGNGLPPAWDNSSRWSIMSPLLANTAMDPSSADINFAAAHFREVLRLRYSSPLFRLQTEADINARTSHYNTSNAQDALIVMRLSDEVAPDLDANYENILVFFNANKMQQSIRIDGANGFVIHPLQRDGLDDDPVVQAAGFDDATDTFTIPPRTTVVFVSTQAIVPPAAPSTLDWVGLMWPRGGVANQVNQGAFAPAGFDLYVQVYEAGLTSNAGQGSGIQCSLRWGQYGATWSDLPMTYNADKGNNDEYKATIPQATLNGLAPGTYGFTAHCKKTAESGVYWKADAYDINGNASDDDQGDGLITVIPSADPAPVPAGAVFVHLFEWRWVDIEKECTYLAQKGYTAVQVSPPNEHLVPTADQGGQTASDYPWWVRYQPVTHDTTKFTSRSGTLAEFQSMVNTCNSKGVAIYVDAVFNHMADIEVGTPPAGTSGTPYDSTAGTRYYGSQYTAADFHTDCSIQSYQDRVQVQRCKLSGLPDLNTGGTNVQTQVRSYLQGLLNMGVKGFRIDGAKHEAAQDLAAILSGLTLPGGGSPYVYSEVIDYDTSERVRDWEYFPYGDVSEFEYSITAMGSKFNCGGSISDLQTLTSFTNMMPDRFAVVFTDNHDNQRGHGPGGSCIVDHRDGAVYNLANIFTLAYPYGYPMITSSYWWSNDPNSQTGDSKGPPSADPPYTTGSGPNTRPVYAAGQVAGDVPANCSATDEDGKWVCEHRRGAIANLVKFRRVTAGEPVVNWQNIGGAPSNHIAFDRGVKGFVAINRTANSATTTYATNLPPGTYCNVAKYDFLYATGQCVQSGTTTDVPASENIVVTASALAPATTDGAPEGIHATGQIANRVLGGMDAIAIHVNAQVGQPLAVDLAYFQARNQAPGVRLVWETVSEVDNLGFHLYRATAAGGPWTKLNAALIPAITPGSSQGHAYDWLDADLAGGTTYYYLLEDVTAGGEVQRHGPIEVVITAPNALNLAGLRAQSHGWTLWAAGLLLLAAAGCLVARAVRRSRA